MIYRDGLIQVNDGLNALLSTNNISTPESKESLATLVAVLEAAEENVRVFRVVSDKNVTTFDELPPVEKEFNRAKSRMAEEMRSLVANLDQTTSIFERARILAKQLLEND